MKSKNPTGATGRKCVQAVRRDTRWWRATNPGKQNNQSQCKNAEVPGCVQTGTSSLIWLHASQGYKTDKITKYWGHSRSYRHFHIFAIYKATISTWLSRILKKGGAGKGGRSSIWSPWTSSLRTQSSLNYNPTVNFRWPICKNSLWVSRASQMLTSRRTSKWVNLTLRRWHKVHLFIQNVAHG